MKLIFSEQARDDYLYWEKVDKKLVQRPLKHALSGYWSRRTNDEHRIVYKISDGDLFIAQLRYQY